MTINEITNNLLDRLDKNKPILYYDSGDICRLPFGHLLKEAMIEYARSIVPESKEVSGDFRECCEASFAQGHNICCDQILDKINSDSGKNYCKICEGKDGCNNMTA